MLLSLPFPKHENRTSTSRGGSKKHLYTNTLLTRPVLQAQRKTTNKHHICIHSDFGQQQRTTVADERELRRKLAILPLEGLRNTETDVLSRKNLNSAFHVQQSDDSLNSAIHTAYRSSLRPSSLHEPRHPSLKV